MLDVSKPARTVEVVENKTARLNFLVNKVSDNFCWYKNGVALDLKDSR